MGTPHKFTIGMAAATLVAALALAGSGVWFTVQNSLTAAQDQLQVASEVQTEVISLHMDSLRAEAEALAALPETREALQEFSQTYREWMPERLRALYISNNPYARTKREFLVDANDGSSYSEAHRTFHPLFQKWRVEGGFEDVYLATADGEIVYSTGKYRDFATNLLSGAYEDTQLSRALRKAIAGNEAGKVTFSEFEAYEPLFGEHAGFFIALLKDTDDSILGAVMVRVSPAPLAFAANASLPDGVEGMIVGPDSRALSDSGAAVAGSLPGALPQVVSAGPTWPVRHGRRGAGAFTSLDGSVVIGAYGPVPALGARWASVVEKDRASIIRDAFSSLIPLLLGASAAALVLLVAFQGGARVAWSKPAPAVLIQKPVLADRQGGMLDLDAPLEGDALKQVLVDLRTKLVAQEQELEASRKYIMALEVFERRGNASERREDRVEDALASEHAEPNSGSRLISQGPSRRVGEG